MQNTSTLRSTAISKKSFIFEIQETVLCYLGYICALRTEHRLYHYTAESNEGLNLWIHIFSFWAQLKLAKMHKILNIFVIFFSDAESR